MHFRKPYKGPFFRLFAFLDLLYFDKFSYRRLYSDLICIKNRVLCIFFRVLALREGGAAVVGRGRAVDKIPQDRQKIAGNGINCQCDKILRG
jgi:hypothetical protein